MKVVFRKRLFDKLLERITEAKRDNRTIDYIILTESEYRDLRSDRRYDAYYYPAFHRGADCCHFRTIELKVPIGLQRKLGWFSPYFKVAVHEDRKFMDVALVVVPDNMAELATETYYIV